MIRQKKAEGIILYKKNILKDDKLICLFSKEFGKMILIAKGIRKITSKRQSHLETGNYIKCVFQSKDHYNYLQETEICFGFSKIKQSCLKLDLLYNIFFVLNKILPENVEEKKVFDFTLNNLKKMNNQKCLSELSLEKYLSQILIDLGFISEAQLFQPNFNPIKFTESVINSKLNITLG